MARIFVSFHHALNQNHADQIRGIVKELGHADISVNEGTRIENEDEKTGEEIRTEIRDKFLRNVDVTIVIVGTDTVNRKHIDWEIRSTLNKFDKNNGGSIVVINATTFKDTWILDEELILEYDGFLGRKWSNESYITKEAFEWLPERLANSLVNNYDQAEAMLGNYKHAVFPIVNYSDVKQNHKILKLAIKQAIDFRVKNIGKWDLHTKMRRRNNEKPDRKRYQQVEW